MGLFRYRSLEEIDRELSTIEVPSFVRTALISDITKINALE
jgi:hypothetical protein